MSGSIQTVHTVIRAWRSAALGSLLALSLCSQVCAQSGNQLPNAPQPQNDSSPPVTLRRTARNILADQEAIWTSPARLKDSNAVGPALLVLATAGLITTDHEVMSKHFLDPSRAHEANTASNGLLGGFVAAPVILYDMGHIKQDDHATETGILGGEAMADSLAVDEVLKLVTMRERPALDGAKGRFFQTNVGFDSSFPSTHCMIVWSSAAAIASEYRGPLTQIAAYGLATGVSVARVVGRQHFPSDVLVGSAVGWMIGRYVVHRHRHAD
ncbi:MAG TPA: phosphatase PAP2 family protein [Terracidiphilus sp.]